MIIFLYGENDFSSSQKVKEIKDKFLKSPGAGANLQEIDFADKKIGTSFAVLSSALTAIPFLSKSRLLIIKNIFKNGSSDLQERLADFLKNVPSTTNVVFWERGVVDKRIKLFKALLKIAKSKQYQKLNAFAMSSWIKKEIFERDGKIEPGAAELFSARVGTDLSRTSLEIEKLLSYAEKEVITPGMVKNLVADTSEAQIFSFVDAVSEKNLKMAMRELARLRKKEHPLYIFKMITYGFRNLLLVADYLKDTGDYSQFNAARDLKLHPFVVKKTFAAVKNFTFAELKEIYKLLLENDIAMKSGKIDPDLAIDILVTKLCKGAILIN